MPELPFLSLFGVDCVLFDTVIRYKIQTKDLGNGGGNLHSFIIRRIFDLAEGGNPLAERGEEEFAGAGRSRVLQYGSYKNVKEGNEQLVLSRSLDGQTVLVALNIADHPAEVRFSCNGQDYTLNLEPFGSQIIEA